MESLQVDRVEAPEDIENFEASDARRAVATKPTKRSWTQVLRHEVRTHPFGYGVLAVALVAGPILLRMIFPEVTVIQSIVGGLAFGVYLALCAVPQKFM